MGKLYVQLSNLIPLPARKVEEMVNRVKPLQFNRLYNAFHRVVKENANEAVERSAEKIYKSNRRKVVSYVKGE